MKFLLAILMVCAAAPAQTGGPDAEKPPAEVDKALRARANEFYTMLLNEQYRKAEAIVADDTKDFYYDGSKPKIMKFDVQDIQYSDNFTKAVIHTLVTQKVMMPTNDMGEWTLKIPSAWKVENGQWFWYVDQSNILNPVGRSTQVDGKTSAGDGKTTVAGIPKDIPKTADFAMGKVTLERQEITIAPGATEKISVANGSQGQVRLMLFGQIVGVQGKIDHALLNAGERTVLTVEAAKEATGAGTLYVQVLPLGEPIPVQIKVK